MADEQQGEKIAVWEWVVAVCSFIPFIGFLTGIVAIVMGAIRFKVGGWILILMGLAGMALTVGLSYAGYQKIAGIGGANSGIYLQMSRKNLTQAVMAVEFYKQTNGSYPEKLAQVSPVGPSGIPKETFLFDSSAGLELIKKLQLFQYERSADGNTYYLFGVGPDLTPGTADDVYPDLPQDQLDKVGYRKKQ